MAATREKTLFERLRDPAPRDLSSAPSLEALARSIHRNLQRVLNSRQGHALAALDYGSPDLTDLPSTVHESTREVEEAIRDTIEKYEPRLRDVEVSFSQEHEDVLTASFEIVGRIVMEDEDAAVRFESRVGFDGDVDVRW
jgi:type VI secretion system protein